MCTQLFSKEIKDVVQKDNANLSEKSHSPTNTSLVFLEMVGSQRKDVQLNVNHRNKTVCNGLLIYNI